MWDDDETRSPWGQESEQLPDVSICGTEVHAYILLTIRLWAVFFFRDQLGCWSIVSYEWTCEDYLVRACMSLDYCVGGDMDR